MYLSEFWFSLGICPVVGLLGHMVVLFLIFKGTSILFSIVAVSIYTLSNSAWGLLFFSWLSSMFQFSSVTQSCLFATESSKFIYFNWRLITLQYVVGLPYIYMNQSQVYMCPTILNPVHFWLGLFLFLYWATFMLSYFKRHLFNQLNFEKHTLELWFHIFLNFFLEVRSSVW